MASYIKLFVMPASPNIAHLACVSNQAIGTPFNEHATSQSCVGRGMPCRTRARLVGLRLHAAAVTAVLAVLAVVAVLSAAAVLAAAAAATAARVCSWLCVCGHAAHRRGMRSVAHVAVL